MHKTLNAASFQGDLIVLGIVPNNKVNHPHLKQLRSTCEHMFLLSIFFSTYSRGIYFRPIPHLQSIGNFDEAAIEF